MTEIQTEDFLPKQAVLDQTALIRNAPDERTQAEAFGKIATFIGTLIGLRESGFVVMTALASALPLQKDSDGDIDMDNRLLLNMATAYHTAMKRWPRLTPDSMIGDCLSLAVFPPEAETREMAVEGLQAIAAEIRKTPKDSWARKTSDLFAQGMKALRGDVQKVGDSYCEKNMGLLTNLFSDISGRSATPQAKTRFAELKK